MAARCERLPSHFAQLERRAAEAEAELRGAFQAARQLLGVERHGADGSRVGSRCHAVHAPGAT